MKCRVDGRAALLDARRVEDACEAADRNADEDIIFLTGADMVVVCYNYFIE